jgi:hypothetical protein
VLGAATSAIASPLDRSAAAREAGVPDGWPKTSTIAIAAGPGGTS